MAEAQRKHQESTNRSQSTAEKLRAIREQTNRGLADHRQRLEADHRQRLENVEAEVSRRVEEALAEHRQSATEPYEQSLTQSADLGAVEELAERCQSLEAELAEQQSSYEALAIEACQTCEATAATLSEAEHSVAELTKRVSQRDEENQALAEQVADSAANRETLLALLERAKAQVAELQDAAAALDELEPLQQKFDLALADVQKLKKENAALREQLALRPEVNAQESAELISIRAERDALALRIEELESAPAPVVDDYQEQELAELQQRFEQAVEDLREYKLQASDLREKLLAAEEAAALGEPKAVASSDGGAFDWQAQKARLIAQLDEEANLADDSPQHRADRATIEGTIKVTDQVVAEKDRQIAELEAQLSSAGVQQDDARKYEQKVQAVLDVDEVVQKEVKRLHELQDQWEEKVRKSELELSIERAKLARERSKIEEKMDQFAADGTVLESPRDADDHDDAKPQRRWLAALGLQNDAGE